MKLNIGSGGEVEGYVSIDRKQGREAYPLDYPVNSVDEVRASHILEHFGRGDILKVLKEWVRVLKPGGYLKIAVPDFDYIVAHQDDPQWQGYLFGGQTDEDDYHKSTFTAKLLTSLLWQVGLVNIETWTDEVPDCHTLPVSLNLKGAKPISCFPARLPKDSDSIPKRMDDGDWQAGEKPLLIVAVMSCPRLGWTDTFGSIEQAFFPLGIQLFRHSGVFWGQGLTKLIESAIAQGADFIITLDYDSVFTREHVERLCQLAVEEDVDAIVSVQVRRENNYSMFTMRGGDGELKTRVAKSEFKQPLTRITTGHFGLTIIRVEAFRKLNKPWFLAIPDKDGEWNEGHVDEDIYFWHNAERSGWKVCLANEVRIGHLQNVIAWPKDDFSAEIQYVSQYNEHGQPGRIEHGK